MTNERKYRDPLITWQRRLKRGIKSHIKKTEYDNLHETLYNEFLKIYNEATDVNIYGKYLFNTKDIIEKLEKFRYMILFLKNSVYYKNIKVCKYLKELERFHINTLHDTIMRKIKNTNNKINDKNNINRII